VQGKLDEKMIADDNDVTRTPAMPKTYKSFVASEIL
jgi:hypothetical protein